MSYTAMLLYLFFDFSLSTYPKRMETEKLFKAADSPLQSHMINISNNGQMVDSLCNIGSDLINNVMHI